MDLETQFNALEMEHLLNPFPALSERLSLLRTLRKALQIKAYDLADAINKDFRHRSQDESLLLDIFPVIKASTYCIKHLKSWMKKRKKSVSWMFFPAHAYLYPQPLGVVGIIVPWNYPVNLSLIPALYALAAGNRVMIKMSEQSEHTATALKDIIHQYNLDSFIHIIQGDVDKGKEFASLPFAHLLFTGSNAVGKMVMKEASTHLTRVTLELGGKNPVLVSPTMKLDYFPRLIMGKLFNAGQTCIAPDYLLVPMGMGSKIETKCIEFINKAYPDLINNQSYTSIISEERKQRLIRLIEDAELNGARVVSIGTFDSHSTKLPFYLLFGVNSNMNIMKEEIFGPILPILSYKSLNEAVEFINSKPNPLVLYYFGQDKAELGFIKKRTLSGALVVNETLMYAAVDDLPFGGVGDSGMGQYHGIEGFNTFSNLKPIMIQKRFSALTWFYPPYNPFFTKVLHWLGGINSRNSNGR